MKSVRTSRKPGYTLLEMLIAVTIFSGLLILILGTFARSASSSARVSILREKSEVARSVMSQITNEFRYVYFDANFQENPTTPLERGYYFKSGGSGLVMVLRFPGSNTDQLVRKEYSLVTDGSSARLMAMENRGCRLNGSVLNCETGAGRANLDVLPSSYVLNHDPINQPVFSGREPEPTVVNAPTGFLKLQLAVKNKDYSQTLCSALPVGTCFKVETILAAGDVR